MPTEPDDDALLRSILEEAAPAAPDEAAIQAALRDPTLAGVIARAIRRGEGILTEKGMERARRDLAVFFLTSPRAAALLAKVREGAPGDASAAVPTGKHQGQPARGRKTRS